MTLIPVGRPRALPRFGQIEDQGFFGFTLVEGDGTRHALQFVATNVYETRDGSFIRYVGNAGSGSLFQPDGTRMDLVRRAVAFVVIRQRSSIATVTTF